MLKKMMLMALSVGALVAFAAPAAQADHYFHNGGAIPGGHIVVSYVGEAGFTIPGVPAGVSCPEVTAEVTVETESAQVISFFGVNCEGTDAFAPCTVETAGVHGLSVGGGLPWAIDAETSEDLKITGAVARNGFASGCMLGGNPVPGAEVNGTVTVTPAEPGNLEHLTLSGTLESALGPAEVNGTVTAEEPLTTITFEP